MNFSDSADSRANAAPDQAAEVTVLAREAGIPFTPPLGTASGLDPFVEWLSLMEVVQMLCPVWPVRDTPMQGHHWRL